MSYRHQAAPGEAETWGYCVAASAEDLLERYRALLHVVGHAPVLSGFCYTQFADTFQEANGLLYADRTPKLPLQDIQQATSCTIVPGAKRDE